MGRVKVSRGSSNSSRKGGMLQLISSKKEPNSSRSKDRSAGPRHAEATHYALAASKVTPRQLLTLCRRLAILAAALFYVITALQSCVASFRVLIGAHDVLGPGMPYNSFLVGEALGDTTIQESPLVHTLLHGDTSPRNNTLYLFHNDQDELQLSTTACPIPSAVDAVYADDFLRTFFSSLVHGTSYNMTFLNPTANELVAPLVDCTSGGRQYEDPTAGRFLFVLRGVTEPTKVSVLVINLSNQGFASATRNEMGAASVMTIALLTDMTESVDNHFVLSLGYPFEQFDMVVYEYVETTPDSNWKLRSLPRDPKVQVPSTVLTACRTGFYDVAENTQSNINNLIWDLDTDPKLAATTMQWRGAVSMHDSWAWVHFVHAFLTSTVLFHVCVLLVITFRNLRVRKFWIGDAFVAISSSLVPRGILVLVSIAMNQLWVLKEFGLSDAARISAGNHSVYTEIVHADLLAVYLSLVGLLGKMLRVRIDPALTVAMFEVGFRFRTQIIAWSPTLTATVVKAGLADFAGGIVLPEDETLAISPMLLWGPYKLSPLPFRFFATILFPIVITMVPLVILSLGLKVVQVRTHRKFGSHSTDSQVVPMHHSNRSDASASEWEEPDAAPARTNFELATGAHLADQFGLVGDYDNYKHIKGLRFASADGVYSNGFVVVNNTFLVQTDDLLTIAMMRLLRVRFRNVYAYIVEEHSVGEMARLVYPDTMTFADLLRIDISMLT